MARPKSPELTVADALKAARVADDVLQKAGKGRALREAALHFASAERAARSAKRRENKLSVVDALEGK